VTHLVSSAASWTAFPASTHHTSQRTEGADEWRKRLEITLETRRLVLRRSNNQTTVWCLACSSPVQSVSPEEAAGLAGVNTRTVYRWVEAEQLHFIETAEKTSSSVLTHYSD
jgi:hypothetical protein